MELETDSEILAAIQTVGTVIRTQMHGLEADKFRMFSGSWNWQGFCRDSDLCRFKLPCSSCHQM